MALVEKKEENFIFTMDGSQHTKQELTDCCGGGVCPECGEWLHIQGAYGCLLERCEGEDCVNGGEHGY